MSMKIYTVSFFGHRRIEDVWETENRAERLIRSLLREKEYVVFLVGRDGEFDRIISSTIRRSKSAVRNDNSSLVWVLPYATSELRDYEESFRDYYDEVEICDASATGYFKNAHQTRNRAMVDRSDLVVFCIQHKDGGAWSTMKYAKKRGVHFINIGEPARTAE